MTLIEDVIYFSQNNNKTIAFFLDYEKAFDTVE